MAIGHVRGERLAHDLGQRNGSVRRRRLERGEAHAAARGPGDLLVDPHGAAEEVHPVGREAEQLAGP